VALTVLHATQLLVSPVTLVMVLMEHHVLLVEVMLRLAQSMEQPSLILHATLNMLYIVVLVSHAQHHQPILVLIQMLLHALLVQLLKLLSLVALLDMSYSQSAVLLLVSHAELVLQHAQPQPQLISQLQHATMDSVYSMVPVLHAELVLPVAHSQLQESLPQLLVLNIMFPMELPSHLVKLAQQVLPHAHGVHLLL